VNHRLQVRVTLRHCETATLGKLFIPLWEWDWARFNVPPNTL